MEVDLEKGRMVGLSISIPAQNASGIPLDAISFATERSPIYKARQAINFTGNVSADGKTPAGTFTQGPAPSFAVQPHGRSVSIKQRPVRPDEILGLGRHARGPGYD